MKKALWLLLTLLLSLHTLAQGEDFSFMKGNCMPSISEEVTDNRHDTRRTLPVPRPQWDATKVYKQMVILFTFSDNEFTMENPKEYYTKLFNERDNKSEKEPGSVADYFRDQSNGLFNLEFDIYGPVKVDEKAQPYASPNDKTRNYGTESIKKATQLVLEENPSVNYSVYDWDGNGVIEQVIYIYAGTPGNTTSTYGYLWPNTASNPSVMTPDNKSISLCSASGEYWGENKEGAPVYCGIGTICHEFSHCLGLPDLYPVGSSDDLPYSAVDEWDLMDGGNFTGWGWCPPNYSPLEKMLLGWAKPVEITEPTSITDLKTVPQGGAFYQVKHTDTEYLLLENRQQEGWDFGTPGKGLVIYYVNYNASAWNNNSVNSFNSEDQFRYRIFHADNNTYQDWKDFFTKLDEEAKNEGKDPVSTYQNPNRMNRLHLSTSPYPIEANAELTDTSTPAATMSNGELLAKPITKIQLSDGLISFDFMGGATAIRDLRLANDEESYLYNLQGQRVYIPLPGQIYIVKKKDGTIKKYVKTL